MIHYIPCKEVSVWTVTEAGMAAGPLQLKFSTVHRSLSESLALSGNNEIQNIFHSLDWFHTGTKTFLIDSISCGLYLPST